MHGWTFHTLSNNVFRSDSSFSYRIRLNTWLWRMDCNLSKHMASIFHDMVHIRDSTHEEKMAACPLSIIICYCWATAILDVILIHIISWIEHYLCPSTLFHNLNVAFSLFAKQRKPLYPIVQFQAM